LPVTSGACTVFCRHFLKEQLAWPWPVRGLCNGCSRQLQRACSALLVGTAPRHQATLHSTVGLLVEDLRGMQVFMLPCTTCKRGRIAGTLWCSVWQWHPLRISCVQRSPLFLVWLLVSSPYHKASAKPKQFAHVQSIRLLQ
jgi:hypothetical protein